MKKYREKQKLLTNGESKVNSKTNSKTNSKVNSKANVNSLDKNKNKNKNKEKEKEKEREREKEKKLPPTPSKKIYGKYKNVRLTDEEYQELEVKYGTNNLEKIIEFFDKKIEMMGYKYDSHYLVILEWAAESALKKDSKEARNYFQMFLES